MATRKRKKQIQLYCIIATICSLFLATIVIVYSAIHKYPIYKGIYLCTLCLYVLLAILLVLFYKKKKKGYQTSCVFFSICLFFSSILVIYQNTIPMQGYHGIDISKWDGEVDLSSKAIDFVIIRCGYTSNEDGTTNKIDDYFYQNIKQCKELGIPYGIYYYSCANTTTLAAKEANYVLSILKDENPPLGVFYDMEDPNHQQSLSKEELTNIATTFLEIIEDNGKEGGIYANYYWWNNKLDHTLLKNYTKWIAIYDEEYDIEDPYTIHQYSDQGTIPGLEGEFDVNIAKYKFW